MTFNTPKPLNIVTAMVLVLLFAMLVTNTGCELVANLIINNQTNMPLTISDDALDKNWILMHSYVLGTALPGEETTMSGLTIRRDIAGWTVRLKATDSNGEVVWQRDLSFEDFYKLEDVGWKITISPETNQLSSE